MDRFKEPTEPRVVGMCNFCEYDMFEGDEVTRFDNGDTVHDGCEGEYVNTAFVWERGTITAKGEIEY